MRVIVQNTLTNRQWIGYDGVSGFSIGRAPGCDVVLDSRFVSSLHATVERLAGGWEVQLPGNVNPIEVDGRELSPGGHVIIRGQARLRIMEFVLLLADDRPDTERSDGPQQQLVELQNLLHTNVLRKLDLRLGTWSQADFSSSRMHQLNGVVDDLLLGEFKPRVFDSELTPLILKHAVRWRLADWAYKRVVREHKTPAGWHEVGLNPDMEATIQQAITRLAGRAGLLDSKTTPAMVDDRIEEALDNAMPFVQQELLENIRTYMIMSFLKRQLYDMVFGLGPLEDLLRSPSITEVMVATPRLIYIERNGLISKVPQSFPSDEAVMSIIERIVAPLGRRIDRSQPMVDARLKDGSRVNAVIEPLAIKGPCVTIRKFPATKVSIDDLIRWQSISPSAISLLRACILMRCNLIISGGTGSGKTTLLNALSGMIPEGQRLVTVEDSAELRLQQEHVVSLETRPPNAEGAGEVTVRDLVRNALRMRPDRIIVGECRGLESIDMLQAMNTGHKGSMTTIHSNGAYDAISRLETMVLMGADIPLQAVRRQIAQAIDVIVHIERIPSGGRLVRQVSEVMALHPTTGEVELRDIMRTPEGKSGLHLRPTGFMPSFLGEMVERGFLQLKSWFDEVSAK